MKADFDTIIYLVITIAILVISGLGSRRKRRMQQTQVPPAPGTGRGDSGEEETEPVPRTAFDELRDRFMSDLYTPGKMQPRAPQMTEEDFFEMGDQKVTDQTVTAREPAVASMEEEMPEKPLDEEEEIMKEIRKRREEGYQPIKVKTVLQPIETIKDEIPQIYGLFDGVDEIKKAIIYSEVMKRKY